MLKLTNAGEAGKNEATTLLTTAAFVVVDRS